MSGNEQNFACRMDQISGNRKKIYPVLLLYGLIAASCLVGIQGMFEKEEQGNYMGARITLMNWSLEQLTNDSVIHLADTHDHEFYNLYLAPIGKFLGLKSWQIFLMNQLFLVFIALLLYPALLYKISDSLLIALVSPFLLYRITGWFLLVQKTDINFIFVWVSVLGLPLLYIWYKEKPTGICVWVTFLALCLVMAVANIFRANSAMFIFVIACCIVIKKNLLPKITVRRVAVTVALLGVLVASYTLLNDIIPAVYLKVAGQGSLVTGDGPWHTVYIGLGWEPNPFGIVFKDECAVDAVKRAYPGIDYVSVEYFEKLKELYLSLFKQHPGYFVLTYFKKFLFCFVAMAYLFLRYDTGVITLFSCVILFFLNSYLQKTDAVSFAKEIVKKYGTVFGFSLANMFGLLIYPLMAVPRAPYILGSLASFEMAVFFLMIALLKSLIAIVKDKR